jgi:hypothetical protein
LRAPTAHSAETALHDGDSRRESGRRRASPPEVSLEDQTVVSGTEDYAVVDQKAGAIPASVPDYLSHSSGASMPGFDHS